MPEFDKKLLILDLDETLIHATEQPIGRDADFTAAQYFVYRRPHLAEFIAFCGAHFEVAVWTSSSAVYAATIVANVFGAEQKPAFVWARDRCTIGFDPETRENFFEKKMWKIRRRGYDLNSVICVDDRPETWRTAYGNLVRVRPFFGAADDDELKHLIVYLERLKSVENIRRFEKRNWRSRLS